MPKLPRYFEGIFGQIDGSDEYKRLINPDKVFTNVAKSNAPSFKITIINRFVTNKYDDTLRLDEFYCTIIEVSCEKYRTHLAYVYWPIKGDEPMYITSNPPFDSRDGEYRCNMEKITELGNMKDDDPNHEIIDHVNELIASGVIKISYKSFPEDNKKMIKYLKNSDITVRALCDSVLNNGRYTPHTNIDSIAALQCISSKVIESMGQAYEKFADVFIQQSINTRGQKMVPMRIREVMEPYNYNLSVWRELFITQYVQDLLVNFITPSVPLYDNWAYIDQIDVSIFENPNIIEKYERSVSLDDTESHIRNARKAISAMKSSQNYYIDELNAKLYGLIEYSQSFLLMSNVVFVHRVEHTGFTFDTIKTKEWINAFGDDKLAYKRIFELVYTAHCLHTKLGISHTDLHTNNIVLYQYDDIEDKHLGRYASYITGPNYENDTYIFPADNALSIIIDYSRCIIGMDMYQKFVKHRNEQYAIDFYREQVNRILRTFHRFIPEYVEANQNQIKAAIIGNLDNIFPILCSLDMISIGTSMSNILSVVACSDDIKRVAKKIETIGRKYLISHLQNPTVKPDVYPGSIVIGEVFSDFRYKSGQEYGDIVDIFNHNNPLKYSGSKPDMFPPWGQTKNFGEYWANFAGEPHLKDDTGVIVIAEQLRTDQEALDGPPINTASSWID